MEMSYSLAMLPSTSPFWTVWTRGPDVGVAVGVGVSVGTGVVVGMVVAVAVGATWVGSGASVVCGMGVTVASGSMATVTRLTAGLAVGVAASDIVVAGGRALAPEERSRRAATAKPAIIAMLARMSKEE